jgi:mannose-6-phosphate isomerase-like protein (cupin superfamily)
MDVRALSDAMRFAPDKMQKVNLFSSAHMFCDVYSLEPRQAQKSHSHATADKIYVVLEGVGRFVVGDEQRDVGAGHAVCAPAGMPHGVTNEGPSRLALLVFMAPNPTPPGANK